MWGWRYGPRNVSITQRAAKAGNPPPEARRFSSTNSEGSSLAVSFWIFLWLKPLRLWQSITVSTGDFYMNYLLVGWYLSRPSITSRPFRLLRRLIIINLIVCRNPGNKKSRGLLIRNSVSSNLSLWDEWDPEEIWRGVPGASNILDYLPILDTHINIIGQYVFFCICVLHYI